MILKEVHKTSKDCLDTNTRFERTLSIDRLLLQSSTAA